MGFFLRLAPSLQRGFSWPYIKVSNPVECNISASHLITKFVQIELAMSDTLKILIVGPAGEIIPSTFSTPILTNVLFAPGYLGGTFFDSLLKHPQAARFDIATYARTEDTARRIRAAGVNAFSADLADLEEVAARPSVIFDFVSELVLFMQD